jgi:ferredoxin
MFIITIDADSCTGCGECTAVCPVEILEVVDEVAEVTGDREECLGCESCIAVCEFDAITLEEE